VPIRERNLYETVSIKAAFRCPPFDRTENPFRQAVLKAPIETVNGVVAIPDAPGLGIEIDRGALAQFKMPEA